MCFPSPLTTAVLSVLCLPGTPSLAIFFCRIAIFGLAFLIATITQLQAAFTRNFHYDMKDDLPKWLMWLVIVTGNLLPSGTPVTDCRKLLHCTFVES